MLYCQDLNAQELSIFELKTATNTVYEKIAEKNQTKSSVLFYYIDFKMKIYAFYSATFHIHYRYVTLKPT